MDTIQFPAGTELTAELTQQVKGCKSILIGEDEYFPIRLGERVYWSLIPCQPNDHYAGPDGSGETLPAW